MEKLTPCYIIQCLRPTCRFRFPASTEPIDPVCPKCGSPVKVVTYENQIPENMSQDVPAEKIEILLDNVRSAYNVGSILRTSDAVKISHIHLCGTSPTPDNPKVRKTALGAEFSIPWSLHWNALDAIMELKQKGYSIISLELAPTAISIYDLQPDQIHFPLVLVVGNEVTGVDPEILAQSEYIIQIPMLGRKGSINVASAYGIAVYFLRYFEGKAANRQ